LPRVDGYLNVKNEKKVEPMADKKILNHVEKKADNQLNKK